MPKCQAKFCTVRRGQGYSTFSIPDPKREYDLCKRWIHNLGNEKLDIETFVFAYHKFVCEKHFEEDCFADDLEAHLMNFKPRKRLKRVAVPTIFLDSKIPKKKETNEKRKKKEEESELLESILGSADDAADNGETIESWRLVQKRKGGIIHTGKSKKTKSKHLRMLQFKNPGKFMEDFDPERSAREMRKMNRRIYRENIKKNQVYDENGILLENSQDMCDCLDLNCQGCHFPCPKCGSQKCGSECRCGRKWIYEHVEVEGANLVLKWPQTENTNKW